MKRMHLKRTLSLLIAVLTMIPLSVGCGTEEETDTTSEVGNAVQEETEYVQTWESPDYSDFEMPGETNELVVYSDGTASFLPDAVGIFKKLYPDVSQSAWTGRVPHTDPNRNPCRKRPGFPCLHCKRSARRLQNNGDRDF